MLQHSCWVQFGFAALTDLELELHQQLPLSLHCALLWVMYCVLLHMSNIIKNSLDTLLWNKDLSPPTKTGIFDSRLDKLIMLCPSLGSSPLHWKFVYPGCWHFDNGAPEIIYEILVLASVGLRACWNIVWAGPGGFWNYWLWTRSWQYL